MDAHSRYVSCESPLPKRQRADSLGRGTDNRNIPALGRIGDPDDIIASVRVENGEVSRKLGSVHKLHGDTDAPFVCVSDFGGDVPTDAVLPFVHIRRRLATHRGPRETLGGGPAGEDTARAAIGCPRAALQYDHGLPRACPTVLEAVDNEQGRVGLDRFLEALTTAPVTDCPIQAD